MMKTLRYLAGTLPLVLAFVLLMAAPVQAREVTGIVSAQQPYVDTEPSEAAEPAASAPSSESEAEAPAAEAPMHASRSAAAPAAPAAPAPAMAAPVSTSDSAYVMGIGDKMHIIVFGEADLTGDFEVNSTGMVAMPLIGEVKAGGQTISQLQNSITAKLREGYMKDPRVSVQINNYRPFFIVGEVMKPGSYVYVNGMTVINAVALASGYTYRADKSGITLRRGGANGKESAVGEDAVVLPGDVIRVPERFF